jgi:hypothetical protein
LAVVAVGLPTLVIPTERVRRASGGIYGPQQKRADSGDLANLN